MIAPDGAGVSGETTAACKEKPKTHPKAKAKSALQAAPRPFKSPTVVVLHAFVDEEVAVDEKAAEKKAAEKKKADRLKEIQEFEVLCDRLEFKIIDVPGDGHCLFHALRMSGHARDADYRALRLRVATEILRDAEYYATCMVEDPVYHDETPDIAEYCEGVRGDTYGGMLEC